MVSGKTLPSQLLLPKAQVGRPSGAPRQARQSGTFSEGNQGALYCSVTHRPCLPHLAKYLQDSDLEGAAGRASCRAPRRVEERQRHLLLLNLLVLLLLLLAFGKGDGSQHAVAAGLGGRV